MQYVKGYFRGKDVEAQAETPTDIVPFLLLFVSCLVMLAVIYWQATLLTLVVTTLAYLARTLYLRNQGSLKINYMTQKARLS
jgi:hypothetical protein